MTTRHADRLPRLLLGALGGLTLAYLLVVVVWPFCHMLASGGASSVLVLGDGYYWKRIGLTVLQGALAALLCGVLGVPVAWYCFTWRFPGHRWWLRALLLPFLVPTVVAALAVLSLVGHTGVLPWSLEEGFPLLMWGYLFYNLGLVVWMSYTALGRVPASSIMAARTLGASPAQILRRVVWPVIRPGVLAALLLTFLFCSTSFGVALMLGGRFWSTLEVEIYSLTTMQLDLGTASVLALLQCLWCALLVGLYARQERVLPLPQSGLPLHWPLTRLHKLLASLLMLLVSALVLAPLLALLWQSLAQGGAGYRLLWQDESWWPAVGNTLRFALLTLPLAAVLGAVLARVLLRWPRLGALAGYAPYLVSASVLSLGLLISYPAWAGSLALLIAGYVLLAYPFVTRNLTLAWRQLPPQQAQAARNLGANTWQTGWRVVWPQLLPGLRVGLAFAAASMLGEFAVTLFLQRPEWATVTTLIYEHLGRPGRTNLLQAQAAACQLLLLASGVFALIMGGRQRA
ncbi:ABC transporter permease [Leeia sp.]|uniref:ABC transporter permease n=1 Tax=Leeia sp. TaxID=2884678 RepID=UPI0035B4B67C